MIHANDAGLEDRQIMLYQCCVLCICYLYVALPLIIKPSFLGDNRTLRSSTISYGSSGYVVDPAAPIHDGSDYLH